MSEADLLQERKKEILFMRRLENDGAKIVMNEEERELLVNAENKEEVAALGDLDAAVTSDLVGYLVDRTTAKGSQIVNEVMTSIANTESAKILRLKE